MIRRSIGVMVLCALLCVPLWAVGEEARAVRRLAAQEERPALGLDGVLEAHFINVAAADCVLLRMDGQTMLIDCGRLQHSDRVLDYFRELGVERLDYAFLTHPHGDHAGGFLSVLREIPVGAFLYSSAYPDHTSDIMDQIDEILTEKEIPLISLASEDEMALGGAELTFYDWPEASAAENDRAMMLMVRYGGRGVLFTADVENNGQRALAEKYGAALGADILKMPHHGLAPYMAELHEAVRPELAIFTNGRTNIQPVITTTESRGVDWMLTVRGTVVATTDGEGWSVWQAPNPAK